MQEMREYSYLSVPYMCTEVQTKGMWLMSKKLILSSPVARIECIFWHIYGVMALSHKMVE